MERSSSEESKDARIQSKRRSYRKTSGFCGLRGEAFEYKTCAHLFVRASNEKYEFQLGSSVCIFDGFDDIVFVFKTPDNPKHCLFLQMKNKSKAKVRLDGLLNKKHDFSLTKLYESYIKIEDKFKSTNDQFPIDLKFENCIFVLYTNADVDSKTLKLNDVVQNGPEKIAMTRGSVLRLNEKDHKEVYENLTELPKLKEFLNKFVIMYNQASENDLNCLIFNEINAFLTLSDEEKQPAFHKFHDLILDWWKKPDSSFYLTNEYGEHNPLRKTSDHIEDIRLTSLMKERRCEVDKLELKFSDSVLKNLKEVVGKKKATLIKTSQHSIKITSAKIHQLLDHNDEYGILRFEDFHDQKSYIWRNDKFRFLVMQIEKSSEDFDRICYLLSRLVSEVSEKTKIIFIMNEENTNDIKSLKKHFLDELEIHNDSSTYEDLSQETRMNVLRKRILFQGCELELKEIGIKTLDWLDEPYLPLLLQVDKPKIGAKPPDPVDCYIRRTLKCHSNSNPDARKLKRLFSTIWEPDTVLDGEDRVVIVTSEPGMGKSTLLTHLFRTTKELHPNKWIVRIDINDFTKMLDRFKKSGIKEDDTLKLLEKAATNTELEKKLLNYIYKETRNLIILVDGIDEISPDYCKEAFHILRELYLSKVEKMWVTSRPHLKFKLEKLFDVQSFSLIPFNREDQKCFLTNYWRSKIDSLDEETLEVFLKHILELSSKFLGEKDLDFMGIPLQILLLAEFYLEKLQSSSPKESLKSLQYVSIPMLYAKYIDKKWKICNEEKLKTDLTKVQAIKNDLILKNEFIKSNKFAAILTLFSSEELTFINDDTVKTNGEKYLREIEEEGDKTGLIVRAYEGKAQFVHRTMAEYFAAGWIFDNWEKNKSLLRNYIFKSKHKVTRRMLDYFIVEGLPLHMSILNRTLTGNSENFHMEELISRRDKMGRTPLHIAVMYELPNETKILLQHGADINVRDKIMEWNPVEYAQKMCKLSAEVLEGSLLGTVSINNKLVNAEIMDARPETIKVWACQKNPNLCHESYLYVAAKHGLVNLLTHFVNKRENINAKVHGGHRLLMHELSYFGQVETMKVILKLEAKIDIVDGYGNTALHISVGRNHKNVASLLLDSGLDVNLRNISGCTALHLAVILYRYDLVELLVSKDADVNSKDDHNFTPLTLACSSGDEKLIKLLQGADVKSTESE